ncbi:MAG TPA: serine/threonine-protein kinase [Chitinispirillaceae bacterium]|nr:serine/threonine-protein kinase [Chitinispirillaceae bacterium]
MIVSKKIVQRNESNESSAGEKTTVQEYSNDKNPVNKKSTTDFTRTGISRTTTSFNIGKKITGGLDTGKKQTIKDTGLNAVSIDTDSFTKTGNKTTGQNELFATSIDTNVLINQNTPYQKFPLIIDEPDATVPDADRTTQASVLKKEKVPQQNISIDISSEFHPPLLPSESAHEQLGTGTIVGVLGSGGMAKVYKTWNEKLEIYRAVKILMPTNQKEQWDRFITEAKITAKLHHPNIIETYDTGEWHGLPFIEMELIEGDTIADLLLKCKSLPSPVCAAMALQVAKALAYAHLQEVVIYGKKYHGIIHRDLKPSNIMVTSSGEVKLMDFGVARPIEAGLHTVATDSIVGTVHYFSPEQIAGYPVDVFTDVYSFGAVLYELLSGSNPFPQNNMVQLIQAKTRNNFIRLEDFNVEMDFRLTSVAQTCLRTDKKERYENFSLVKSVLEDIVVSYNLGSPEQIIQLFYNNPDALNQAFEHFSHFKQVQPSIPPVNQVQTLTPAEIVIEVEKEKTPVLKQQDNNFVAATKNEKLDMWENTVERHNAHLVIAILLLITLIAGVVLFTQVKPSEKAAGSFKYVTKMIHSVNNVLTGK